MKFLAVFLVLSVVASAYALTPEQKDKIRDHFKVCTSETGADKALVSKVRSGDYSVENDKLKNFMFCLYKRMEIMSEDGAFHKDVAVKKVGEDVRDKVSKAIDACVGEKGSTHAETAWKFAKCYHKERPDHEVV